MQCSSFHAVHGALKRMKNGLQPQNTENRDKAGQYRDPRTYTTLGSGKENAEFTT